MARRALRLLLLLAVIVVAAALALPLLPLSPLKNAAERKLSEILGRETTIASVRLNVFGGPYLTLTGVSAKEDPSFGEDIFLKADEALAELDLVEFVRTRQLVIQSLTLKTPQINFVKNANGVWSWTTLGKAAEGKSIASALSEIASSALLIKPLQLRSPVLMTPVFRKLIVEDASVKLIDRTGAEPPEVLYNNIALSALLSTSPEGGRQVKGDLDIQSSKDGQAELLKAHLPFDLLIEGASSSSLSISGLIGPGPIESENLRVGEFALNGKFNAGTNAPLAGEGRISASEMLIRPINVSERVAAALKIDQIGDMNSGTTVSSLETDFNFSRAAVNTTGLRIQQLDGLGDATAQSGSFDIQSALTLNYAATINLSPDATSRVKATSPMLGMILTILETNNRVSVPLEIRGDVRQPQIRVDVSRIF